jgi:hypothetical protein
VDTGRERDSVAIDAPKLSTSVGAPELSTAATEGRADHLESEELVRPRQPPGRECHSPPGPESNRPGFGRVG